MPGSLPAQSQKWILPNQNYITTGLKYRTKEADQHKGIEREAKQTKESEHWLNQTSTSNRYIALLEEESVDQQQKADPVNMPKTSSNLYNWHYKYFTTHTAARANSNTAIWS
jgi:hypothetical protein